LLAVGADGVGVIEIVISSVNSTSQPKIPSCGPATLVGEFTKVPL
jgi:hypothetical protein